jgi:hypothetical protein
MRLHDRQIAGLTNKLVVWNDAELNCLSVTGWERRHDAVARLLEQVERDHQLPPCGPLLVQTTDHPVTSRRSAWRSFAFCTAEGYADIAVPDFVFGGWPEVGIDDYDQTCRDLVVTGEQPAQRPVTGWIGSLATHPVRPLLHQLGRQHPDVLDVRQVEWAPDPFNGAHGTAVGSKLSMPEQVALWSALLDVQGTGYSGRLKMLLHSGRPVLVVDRPWREWFWDHLEPMTHYIPVRRDLSDLVDKARWVQDHREEAAAIGRAGQRLAQRLLTRSSAVAEWARILSNAANLAPAPWAPPKVRAVLAPTLRGLGATD